MVSCRMLRSTECECCVPDTKEIALGGLTENLLVRLRSINRPIPDQVIYWNLTKLTCLFLEMVVFTGKLRHRVSD